MFSKISLIQADFQKALNNFKATAEYVARPSATVNLSGLTDNKGKLEISSDTQLQVFGNENRSTGYAWAVTSNTCGSKLAEAQDIYENHPAEGMDGVGGKRTWFFDTPGQNSNHMRGVPCELTFTYKRPWLSEPDSQDDVRVIEVTIV